VGEVGLAMCYSIPCLGIFTIQGLVSFGKFLMLGLHLLIIIFIVMKDVVTVIAAIVGIIGTMRAVACLLFECGELGCNGVKLLVKVCDEGLEEGGIRVGSDLHGQSLRLGSCGEDWGVSSGCG